MLCRKKLWLLIIPLLHGCNSTKYVPDGKFLVHTNKIYWNGKPSKDVNLYNLIAQKSNSKTLSLPLPLYFYNLGNINHQRDSEQWLRNHPKTVGFLNAIFSYKKTKKIFQTYNNFQNWILKSGDPPVIFQKQQAEKTVQNLKKYLFGKGYFNAKVSYKTKLNVKKINTTYHIQTKKPYILDTIRSDIDSKFLDQIYQQNKKNSFLKQGENFDYQNFKNESDRLLAIFRNKGIYNIRKNNIRFYDIDTLQKNRKTSVVLRVENNLIQQEGKEIESPPKVHKIKEIQIVTDYSFAYRNKPYKDSLNYNGYTFLSHEKLNYNPKYLLRSIFMQPDSIYREQDDFLTRKQLGRLNNFKNIKIKYESINDSLLRAKIILTPFKKYNLDFNAEAIHSNIKQIGLSGGITMVNRNFFKGAEILKISFQSSLSQLSKQNKNKQGVFDAWDMGIQVALEMPRFLSPISTEKIINKKNNPRTSLYAIFNQQQNIGLDRQRFTGGLEYTWKMGDFQNHKFEFLNLQYIRNLNPNTYFFIYRSEFEKVKNIQQKFFKDKPLSQENTIGFINHILNPTFKKDNVSSYNIAENVLRRQQIITSDFVIPKLGYGFSYNNQDFQKKNSYQAFFSNLSISGKWFGQDNFFKVPISDFIKYDMEFKFFIRDWNKNTWAFRFFTGVVIPYGHTQEIPFSESFFAGGSNDIRAWKIYEIGLGAAKSDIEFKTGNFKLLANAEYRFKISKQIGAAFFVDVGNIWDITDSELTTSQEKFQSFSDFKNVYIGTGLGIRYDFSFLIFRLDWGLKTYEPYLKGNKWFENYNFNQSEINFGINYPF